MKYLILLFFQLFCYAQSIQAANDDVLVRLREEIKNSQKYDAQKIEEIKKLHQKASLAKTAVNKYQSYIQLFKAYQSYKYDSASVYADKALMVAHSLRNKNYLALIPQHYSLTLFISA